MVKIYIDPGHGGSDPGAVANGLREKDLTLKISKYMRDYLLANYTGVEVRMSRTNDSTVSLSARTNDANKWGANAYISIHINSGGGTGFESYVYPGVGQATRNLQNAVHSEVMKAFSGFRDRGKKQANFHVLRETKMHAVLTENGFIDTKKDADFLKSEANLRKIGEAHAKGVAKYFGLKKKAQQNKSTATTKKTATKSTNTYYRVVTGSFTDRNNAEKRVAELKKAGFESFLDVYKHKGETFYRVITGSFKERTNANKRQEALQKKGFTSFIDVFKK